MWERRAEGELGFMSLTQEGSQSPTLANQRQPSSTSHLVLSHPSSLPRLHPSTDHFI